MKLKELFKKRNVIGVSEEKDDWNDEDTTTVFVTKKLSKGYLRRKIRDPDSEWTEEDLVPKEMNGKPTKVVEIGVVRAETDRKKYDPMKAGMEIGVSGETFVGTGGLLVRYKSIRGLALIGKWASYLDFLTKFGIPYEEKVGLLTNCHVTQSDITSPQATTIIQPGVLGRAIGETIFAVPIDLKYTNDFDVSLVKLDEGADYVEEMIQVGSYAGIKDAQVGDEVHKYGRTTEYTKGKCVAKGATIAVGYPPQGTGVFRGLDLYTHMTGSGDSGSAYLHRETNEECALHFAGSSTVSIGIPMSKVADKVRFRVGESE